MRRREADDRAARIADQSPAPDPTQAVPNFGQRMLTTPSVGTPVVRVGSRGYTIGTASKARSTSSHIAALRPPLHGRVSVLIPAFKTPKLLEGAVRSCLEQELPVGWELEVWVGVDACPDTLRAALALHADHPEVRVVDFDRNSGPYKVLNALFRLSTGEAIAILDSDDLMKAGRLKKQIAALAHVDFVGSLYDVEEGERRYAGPACASRPTLQSPSFAIHSSWCVRRHVYEQLGGYRGWRCGADTDFYIRAMGSGARIEVLQEPLFTRRVRPNQLTSKGTPTGPGSPARQRAQREVSRALESYRQGERPPRVQGEASVPKRIHRKEPRVLVLMPSLPTRQRSAQLVLHNMLRQGADQVLLLLNGHGRVPDWARSPLVTPRLNPRGTGPISRWQDLPRSDFVISVDDDLIYPDNYLDQTVKHLLRLGRGRFLSYHCSHWPPGCGQLDDRVILGFTQSASAYVPKTYMGSGASGFFGSDLERVQRDDVPKLFHRLDDVWMSAATARAGLLLYRPPSPRRWIGTYPEQEEGIYKHEVNEGFRSRRQAIAEAQKLGRWPLTPQHQPLPTL